MKQNSKAPALTLSVEHLVSCEDAQIALVQGEDKSLKKAAWARGHELSSRENWLDFGTLVACKINRNSDGNEFCEITNAAGETSSMKLAPKTNKYGAVIGKNNWELAYHLSDTLTEYKLAKADLHILISAHGNWSTKSYFDLVQVIV
jgi:hypothetical protein